MSAAIIEDASEAQLAAALVRCAQGDRSALRVIYDLEAARMIGVAQRILRRRDLAEDAVHEAFLRIWRSARSYDPARGAARSWLFAVVRNRALTILRDESRFEPDEPLAAAEADPAIARIPENSALRRCLATLMPAPRQAVVLAYVYGMSHGELAGRLGVPLGTAKSLVRRALMALQRCMG